eukprot:SAG31_NODE_7479_length_1679_cov_1.360127_2_plen_119_part_00
MLSAEPSPAPESLVAHATAEGCASIERVTEASTQEAGSVDDLDEEDLDLDLGEEVELKADAAAFRAAYARFEDDDENGWSAQAESTGLGATGVVIEVYSDDKTVALELVGTGASRSEC